jgi:hypothetical protein
MTYVVSGQGSETDISITEAMIDGNEAFTHDLMQHTPSHCERMMALAQELNALMVEASKHAVLAAGSQSSTVERALNSMHSGSQMLLEVAKGCQMPDPDLMTEDVTYHVCARCNRTGHVKSMCRYNCASCQAPYAGNGALDHLPSYDALGNAMNCPRQDLTGEVLECTSSAGHCSDGLSQAEDDVDFPATSASSNAFGIELTSNERQWADIQCQ